MSQNMKPNNIQYEIDSGDLNAVIGYIYNSAGQLKDLSDTVTYNTVQLHVWQPDGTIIINGAGTYPSPRTGGVVSYTLTAPDSAIANAGNWQGRFICYDINSVESDTTITFNFKVNPAY